MPEDIPIDDLDRGERRLILRDIASWKFELERDNNDPERDPVEYVNEATELSDAALVRRWYDTVGEWILSRHDVRKPPTIDDSTWLDSQLGRLLLQGVETDYGFLNIVNLSAVLEDGVGVDREDGRNLYPDNHRHEGYAPDGWSVYEKKNTKHIIFTEEDGDRLCHVVADGVRPVDSIEGGDGSFTKNVDSFDKGIEVASKQMSESTSGQLNEATQ